MVYSDPVVAAIADYESGAEELGVTITKVQIEATSVQTQAEANAFFRRAGGHLPRPDR